jgi:hypothetical protein
MTAFELQTQSGQLWPHIVAYGEALTADANARATKAEKKADRFDKFLKVAESALESGDLSQLKALLQPAVEDEKQSEKARKVKELRGEKDAVDAEAAVRKAKIDEEIEKLNAAAAENKRNG